MKKHGFTLVELLAVIAILAILVLIALPNVMNLFNRAKENAFETEIKEVFKTAQQQWIADSLFSTQEREYASCKSGCPNKLDMSGRSELEYYIKLDKSGNVVTYKVTDGSYQYSYTGTGLKIEDISDVVRISKIDDEGDIISISCDGATGGSGEATVEYFSTSLEDQYQIGSSLPQNALVFDSAYAANNSNPIDIFLKLVVRENIVTEIYAGFNKDGRYYFLRGGDGGASYNENRNILSNITFLNYQETDTYYHANEMVGGRTYTNGRTYTYATNNYYCLITEEGIAGCHQGRP